MSADSKPPFAGEVRRVRLGDVCDVEKADGPSDEKVWLLNLDAVEKNTGRVTRRETVPRSSLGPSVVPFTAESVLYSKLRPNLNKVALPDSNGYATSEMIPLKPHTSVLAREYLASYLRSEGFVRYAAESTAGAKMPRVSRRVVLDAEIPLLPLEEQNAAASCFGIINLLMKGCQCQLDLLDDLVKSRFVEMFGDPFENPMGFSCQNVSSLGELKNGMNFHKGESGVDIRCLGVADFGDRSELRDASELGTASLSTFPPEGAFLRDGDVVFVRSNGNKKLVGRCMAVYPGEEKTIFSGFCIRLRVTSEDVRVPYLVWALKQSSIRDAIVGRGANIKNLSQDTLGKVRLPIPPLNVQDTFLDFAACVAKSQLVVQKQIERLQTLYDSLAQNYFG